MKRIVRLTESDLHRIVKESVNRILTENIENEGLGKWVRAGIDAASEKQRTNPHLQTYKGNHVGDSIANWWSRTKRNAQHEDDIDYINNRTNSQNDSDKGGEYTYQRATQRAKQHRATLRGKGDQYGTVMDDHANVHNFHNIGDANYNYRGNGKWVRS